MKHLFIALSICGLMFLIPSKTVNAQKPPEYYSIAIANTIMDRYPKISEYPYKSWCYTQGYVLMGFVKLWETTGDKQYYDYIMNFVETQVDNDGNIKNFDRSSLDDIMSGALVAWAYKQTGLEKYKLAANKIRETFNDYPRTTDSIFWHAKNRIGEVWIDGSFMGDMFLINYGKYCGDSEWCFNEAARHLIGIHKHLKKGDTGLLLHAWDEDKSSTWADKTTGLSSEVWSEGLGWYALIIVETLDILPKNHPKRAELVKIARSLMNALKKYQDTKTGLWYDIVDKGYLPDNWHDSSGSAMFVYALKKSIELGLIDANEYNSVVEKGYRGLITKARLTPNFGLVDILDACNGVCVQDNYSKYVNFKKIVNAQEAVPGFLWGTWIVEKPELSTNKVNPQKPPKYFSVATANTIMDRYLKMSDYPYKSWSYPQGYILMGFTKLWESTGDNKYYDYIMDFANSEVDSNGDIKNLEKNTLNDIMVGAVVIWAYKQTGLEKYKLAANKLRESLNDYPRTADSLLWLEKKRPREIWIDGAFMGGMFLIHYGKYIGDSEWCFNETARQLIGIHNHLKKGDTGLMLHAWDEDKNAEWADKITGLSSDVWGEGLGWYSIMIVDALELLPENHPKRAELIKITRELMKGLKKYQDIKTGLWYFIVDKGELPDNWTDSSGSSMFLYAVKKAIELGLIDANEYNPVVEKGYGGLLTKARLTPNFGLVDVIDACNGVCVQNNYSMYVNFEKIVNAQEAVPGFLWGTWIVEKP